MTFKRMFSSSRPLLLGGALALLTIAGGCTYSHGDPQAIVAPCDATAANSTFAAVVSPIFQTNCRNACHNTTLQEGGVNFDNFSELAFYANSGSIVRRIKQDPNHPDFMPKGGTKLADCDIARIEAWIAAGTPNN
jgi:cytochrome c553